jgi:hypothetical protein
MNFTKAILGLLIIAALLFSCEQEEERIPVDIPIRINPNESDFHGPRMTDEMLDSNSVSTIEEQRSIPKVDLPNGTEAVFVRDLNLDVDPADEQLMFLRDLEGGNLSIGIIDFDNLTTSYVLSWQYPSAIKESDTIEITIQDLIGDIELEVVVNGLGEDDQQVIEVFRKQKNSTMLKYNPVFQKAAFGTFRIETVKRNSDYTLGDVEPFEISLTSNDPESDNSLDQIKVSYVWNPRQELYIQQRSEKIAGSKIESETLLELFTTNNSANYLKFFEGPWFKTDSDERGNLIFFFVSPQTNEITFLAGDLQEIFIWNEPRGFRVSYRGNVRFTAHNDLITHIDKAITARITGLNSIALSVKDEFSVNYIFSEDDSTWSGTYERYTEDLQQAELAALDRSATPPLNGLPILSGYYQELGGDEIIFSNPYFNKTSKGRSEKGGYAFYYADVPVISMKYISEDGIETKRETFSVFYTEELNETQIIRRLRLIPGRVGINGFKAFDLEHLEFEQIEELETAQ